MARDVTREIVRRVLTGEDRRLVEGKSGPRARALSDLAASLDSDQRDMITGIVEILVQVDDEENRRRIVAGLTRKLRGEGIEVDGELFARACGVSLRPQRRGDT
jgi:hypothetical protein